VQEVTSLGVGCQLVIVETLSQLPSRVDAWDVWRWMHVQRMPELRGKYHDSQVHYDMMNSTSKLRCKYHKVQQDGGKAALIHLVLNQVSMYEPDVK
jgi:hypothetical protein